MLRTLLGAGVITLALFVGSTALAQEPSSGSAITFPIEELGGCNSKAECKTYCDDSTHADTCLAFAEQHKLMSTEQVSQARKLMGQRGPGGCMGSACRTYCSEEDHFDECQKFAKEQGFAGPQGPGVRPPSVSEPTVDEEKAQQLLAEKEGPGGCKTMDECRAYCEDSSHMKQCLAFAKENGLMGEEEIERAEKFADQTGPGGCKGLECKTYCEDESHSSECIAFAKENGFITEEEAQRAQTLIDHPGPGGCRGEACRTYCEDSSHREECFAFAKENGLISEEELQRIEEFKQHFENSENQPPCGTPEECKAMYESGAQGRQEFPGAGSPPYMGNERFRESGDMTAPPGMQKPPEGYHMTPEQQKMYDQYQRGEPNTTNPMPGQSGTSGQTPCGTPEECKAKYELRDSSGAPVEPGQNPQYQPQQYEQQRYEQMSPEQQSQYQQQQFNQLPQEQQQQYQQQYQQPQQYQPSGEGSGSYQQYQPSGGSSGSGSYQSYPPTETSSPVAPPPSPEPSSAPSSWFLNLQTITATVLHAFLLGF